MLYKIQKSRKKKYKVPDRYPVGLWGKKEEIFNRAHFLKNCRSLRKTPNLLWRQGFRVAQDTPHLCPTLHLFLIFCETVNWWVEKAAEIGKVQTTLREWACKFFTLPSFCGVLSLGIDLNNNHRRSRLSIVYPHPPLPFPPQPHGLSSWPPRLSLPHETNNHSPQSQEKNNCHQSRNYTASAIHTLGNYM